MFFDNFFIITLFFYLFVSNNINGTLENDMILSLERQMKHYRFHQFQDLKYPNNNGNIRKQTIIPRTFQFPCNSNNNINSNYTSSNKINNVGRSLRKPTSVHKLRPGDIDVIAAMGDSLIAGNGAMEEWALGTMIEHRGVSWCAGGEGTWRNYLTLPNILKEFNPNLTGYSTGRGEFSSPHSKLNVAFPVSADADALVQAKVLVNRIRKNKHIDFYNDWKMVTIFFGANDICSGHCYNPEYFSPRMHAHKIMLALDYLYNNLPRTFVNLIPVLDVSVSVRIQRSIFCKFLHTLFCSCFHQKGNELQSMARLTELYQEAEERLINSGRYDQREDYTVVIQPFMKHFNAPKQNSFINKNYNTDAIDISYITYDCFHFSQKGHALAANMLWNNIMEPTGFKSQRKMNYLLEYFRCPTKNAPYIFTNKNSKRYLNTGHQ